MRALKNGVIAMSVTTIHATWLINAASTSSQCLAMKSRKFGSTKPCINVTTPSNNIDNINVSATKCLIMTERRLGPLPSDSRSPSMRYFNRSGNNFDTGPTSFSLNRMT